jgi:hypothetical protein
MEKHMTDVKLKFPCCIATSEIKDEETFKAIRELFLEAGAFKAEDGFKWGCPDFNYYGVDGFSYTKFWDNIATYSSNIVHEEEDVMVYTLEDLFPEAEVVTTRIEPFKVVKHIYYDVTIKGEEYRFTKEEANLLCTRLIDAIGEDYEPI